MFSEKSVKHAMTTTPLETLTFLTYWKFRVVERIKKTRGTDSNHLVILAMGGHVWGTCNGSLRSLNSPSLRLTLWALVNGECQN